MFLIGICFQNLVSIVLNLTEFFFLILVDIMLFVVYVLLSNPGVIFIFDVFLVFFE